MLHYTNIITVKVKFCNPDKRILVYQIHLLTLFIFDFLSNIFTFQNFSKIKQYIIKI